MNYLKLINKILKELISKKIIKSIDNNSNIFYDEPKINYYSTILEESPSYYSKNNYQVKVKGVGASGISFVSKKLALIKCLGEAVERFSINCFKKDSIIFSTYNDLINNNLKAIDPTIYLKNKNNIRGRKIGWVEGRDLYFNNKIYIPAQLVYLNYRILDEIKFPNVISTGAAGHFYHEIALLNGIYEIIERDAFMTVWLNKISPPVIDLQKISDLTILSLIKTFHRYNLQPYIINLTNDLSIPVFLTILIDKTGIGPSITLGLKSSLNIKEAIIHSIEEAFQIRPWIRREIMKKKSLLSKINREKIINNEINRAVLWYPISMINKVEFLFNQKKTVIKIKPFSLNKKQELAKVKELMKNKKFHIYYVNVTPSNFRKINYLVYKVIIPGLQPLYLNESCKIIVMDRLKSVASYFGYYKNNKIIINPLPHPFL